MESVEKGTFVRVVRGRKVPRGTEGFVFWTDPNGRFGPRCGFKTLSGETVWVATRNVEAAEASPEYIAAREAERAEWIAKKRAEEAAVEAEIESGARAAPERGSRVVFVEKGEEIVGKVFWVGVGRNGGGMRVGVKVSGGGYGAPEETFWKGVGEVTVLAARRAA